VADTEEGGAGGHDSPRSPRRKFGSGKEGKGKGRKGEEGP